MSQLALDLIAKNKRNRSPFLDLGNCGLIELPQELFDCVWLENLNLGIGYFDEETQKFAQTENQGEQNQIVSLGEKNKSVFGLRFSKTKKNIAELQNLRILTVQGKSSIFQETQRISDISLLATLTNLEVLDFSYNSVSDISPLSNLHQLKILDFQQNSVSDISVLAIFRQLRYLDFSSNSVSDISKLSNLHHLQYLNFGGNSVSDISALSNLQKLQSLYFWRNKVSDISALDKLNKLEYLNFSNNSVSNIESLSNLKNLQYLKFGNNSVSDISAIANLHKLEHLNFSDNQVLNISAIIELKNLQTLELWTNQISDISAIANLHNLQILDFGYNKVSNISAISNLLNLQKLYFWDNQISDISAIANLHNLQELYFSENEVSDISILAQLQNLKYIKFKNTPAFEKLPQSVQKKATDLYDNQTEALHYWLDNFAQKPTQERYLREAKVVFVGEGEVGKTSLMKCLLYDKKASEIRTEKIEIHTCSDKFFYTPKPETKEPLKLYFWDFGGQEIMHATHKFFMTERSLYVLVVSGREDQPDTLEKWLEMLQSSCGDSPILLVINKLDNPKDTHRFPIRMLQKSYNIQGVVETSWQTGRGLAELKTEIQEILQTLPHFNEPFAPKYFAVKERLQALDENYIDYREYEKICLEVAENQSEEFNPTSQKLLADRLNSLGIMLNFREQHENLEELYVFKPQWIINGVYKIINSESVQKIGKIHEEEIFQLLREMNYRDHRERDFIIRMMKYFELAYLRTASNGENYYLIPSTFKPDKPEELENYWDEKSEKTNSLHFRFQYKIWRNDYISFFLVNQHEKIKDEFYWKNGAVLQYGKNEVLIEAHRLTKNIEIQVLGSQDKRYALWQVREALNHVHQKFQVKELGISELVVYRENGEEDSFKVERLKTMLKNGIEKEFSDKFEKMLLIKKLLGEVELSNKEKLQSALENISDKSLSEPQVLGLVDLVQKGKLADFFEELNRLGIQNFQQSRLENEFILGKADADYFQRAITFVKSLNRRNI